MIVKTDNKYYSDIANAIRAKNGENTQYKPSEMALAISNIQSDEDILPEGYTQLEYIEGTGTQYIDTGFYPNQDTRVILDAHVVPTSSIDPVFGARATTNTKAFGLWLTDPDAVNPQYGNVSYGTQTVNIDFNQRLVYELNKNVFTVNGITRTFAEATFSSAYPMYLLQINNGGSAFSRGTKGKIYSFKIYDNDVLVRDFVPCVNPSSVVGLYDMVNNVFYQFSSIPDIPDVPDVPELLWTNSSPSSGFPAQTISKDISSYEAVLIEAYPTSSKRTVSNISYIKKGTAGLVLATDATTSSTTGKSLAGYFRKATINNKNINFAAGYRVNISGTTNSYCIPYRIWGLKEGI